MSPQTRYAPDEVADLRCGWSGDVLVVGGGSAGSSAAVAAARAGARTLLVEGGGFLGGTGTRVLDTFYGFYAPGEGNARVVGGVGWEVCERLAARGMSFERPNTYGAGTGVTYEPEALKVLWDELVVSAGADVLLYGLVTAAVVADGRVVGVVVETRAGPMRLDAAVVVDATGDGDVAWRAGAELAPSLPLDGIQPATSTFRLGGVAAEPATTKEIHALMAEAIETGTYALPRREGSIHVTTVPGVRHANMTRVAGRDLTDPWELTRAEQEGRRQSWEYARFLHDRVPGFEKSYLLGTSPRLGIRETRRLVGCFVLSGEDFREGRSHDDDIARCGAPIEDHSAGGATKWEYVGGLAEPDGATYGIPFGTLVPVALDGLLAAGRFFSATHEAHASARSIAQCMAMGHAVGVAAAMAADSGVPVREVDTTMLRERLTAAGALV
ncbi:MAG: FAD-dependent oxidoreductase [Lapillicoccus sp.]